MMRENEAKRNSDEKLSIGLGQDSGPRDFWPAEREGYSDTPRAAYAAVAVDAPAPPAGKGFSIRAEARIGLLIMIPGIIWFAYNTLTQPGYLMIAAVILPPNGPVGVTGIGILVWLHSKWRRSIRLQ